MKDTIRKNSCYRCTEKWKQKQMCKKNNQAHKIEAIPNIEIERIQMREQGIKKEILKSIIQKMNGALWMSSSNSYNVEI